MPSQSPHQLNSKLKVSAMMSAKVESPKPRESVTREAQCDTRNATALELKHSHLSDMEAWVPLQASLRILCERAPMPAGDCVNTYMTKVTARFGACVRTLFGTPFGH